MNKLAKSLLVGLLENESKVLAFYGGGFKPPTKGHFAVVKKTLQDHPEITKFYIVVGSGLRNNISQDESYSVWNIYKKYLGDKVEIVKAQSPLSYIKTHLEENPDVKTYAVIGTREGNEDDVEDFTKRKEFFEKYGENVEVLNIVTGGGISGTKARKSALESKEKFLEYVPEELTDDEKEIIWSYVESVIKENISSNNFDSFDYPKHIKNLTKFMLDKGLKLHPLPSVKFVNDDAENANNHLKGKTAYYDPNYKRIVLYTLNRHPKDVMRSFAHEMIHHMQNCENRLGNITTQDIDEDDHLKSIEEEAYTLGNTYFRSYTGTLTEGLLSEQKGHSPSADYWAKIFVEQIIDQLFSIDGEDVISLYNLSKKYSSQDFFKKLPIESIIVDIRVNRVEGDSGGADASYNPTSSHIDDDVIEGINVIEDVEFNLDIDLPKSATIKTTKKPLQDYLEDIFTHEFLHVYEWYNRNLSDPKERKDCGALYSMGDLHGNAVEQIAYLLYAQQSFEINAFVHQAASILKKKNISTTEEFLKELKQIPLIWEVTEKLISFNMNNVIKELNSLDEDDKEYLEDIKNCFFSKKNEDGEDVLSSHSIDSNKFLKVIEKQFNLRGSQLKKKLLNLSSTIIK